MATLLQDDFTRADSASVVGSPAVGPAPSVLVGTLGISSNQLYASALTSFRAAVAWDLGTVDVDVQLTVNASATIGGILFGANSNTDTFLIGWGYNSTEGIYTFGLARNIATGTTSPDFIHKAAVTSALPAVPFVIRGVVNDGLYEMYLDGVKLGRTARIPFPLTNTKVGALVVNTSVRYDNIFAEDSSALSLSSHTGHLFKGRTSMSDDAGATT